MKTCRWLQLPSMLTGRYGHGSTIIFNQILVMGGFVSAKSVECYNPASNQWSLRAPMLRLRARFHIGTVNDFVYILGGLSDGEIEVTLSIERYCFRSNTWTLVCDKQRVFKLLHQPFQAPCSPLLLFFCVLDEFLYGSRCSVPFQRMVLRQLGVFVRILHGQAMHSIWEN